MTPILPVPAHGALGPLDEILLIVAVAVFVIMIVVPPLSAIFRRDPTSEPAKPTETPPARNNAAQPDHFRLD